MKKLLTMLVMLGVVTCPVFAGAITDLGLFNTGTSSNWQVGGVAATTATVIPGAWAANTGTSSWISFATNGNADAIFDGASAAPASNYTLQFTVPSTYTLSSIVITGKWALDDYGTASAGSTVFSSMPDGGSHFLQSAFDAQTFTIDSTKGLVQGLNTLAVEVHQVIATSSDVAAPIDTP